MRRENCICYGMQARWILVRNGFIFRVPWMDQRNNPLWNVYYQTSADGGTTWAKESTLSTYVSRYSYIFSDGFRFPFGDYFDLTIDYLDHTQACWGEGYNWLTPGSVWYTRQMR